MRAATVSLVVAAGDTAVMRRPLYLASGILAFATGIIGLFLPLLPTVPFMLLAAFCFSRSNPAWEQWVVDHPRFGPPVRAWRAKRAIPRRAKWLATGMIGVNAVLAVWLLDGPWRFLGLGVGVGVLAWMWTRPDA